MANMTVVETDECLYSRVKWVEMKDNVTRCSWWAHGCADKMRCKTVYIVVTSYPWLSDLYVVWWVKLVCLPILSSVCAESQSLCSILSEASAAGLALDLSPELTRAVTNVICSLCFSSSYSRGDPEFEAMLHYSQGIVDTVAKDSLVDIFPWLQVDMMDMRSEKQRSASPSIGYVIMLKKNSFLICMLILWR